MTNKQCWDSSSVGMTKRVEHFFKSISLNRLTIYRMKYILTLMCALMFVSACKKDKIVKYDATGTIEGIDYGACMCCGGYILKIDGSDSSYRFYSFPSGTSFDTTKFPVKILLNYTADHVCGVNTVVVIQSLTVNAK